MAPHITIQTDEEVKTNESPTRRAYFKAMSTRLLSILFPALLMIACRSKPRDEVLLIFPYGKYSHWVYYNMKYLTFKTEGRRLLIDTVSTPESPYFSGEQSENLIDYPEIERFLKEELADFQKVKEEQDSINCDPVHSIYIKYITGGGNTTLIQLRTTPCTESENHVLNGLDGELERLKTKYAR